MYVQIHKDDFDLISKALMKLQQENAKLKSQLKTEELHTLINNVANRINEWVDEPYHGISERQDIENFAKEITNYIDKQLRN